jgi:hypothetical protein
MQGRYRSERPQVRDNAWLVAELQRDCRGGATAELPRVCDPGPPDPKVARPFYG